MISISEGQKIGVGITGFGVFFILFGTLLYFDSVLLAFGNLLFLTGLSFIIGLRRTFSFFFQRHKLKATSFFLGGVALVLLRWPFLGMLLETYGFFSLFNRLNGGAEPRLPQGQIPSCSWMDLGRHILLSPLLLGVSSLWPLASWAMPSTSPS
ncbi:vesicle transport protein GOT1A isoform X2 [Heterocephalus glaber]|uniref:Vesicle transport protein GOT1A isoform X2 n=1 Tax=Heterocephalus glaber TaxID=10181 RepID=A0AAX6RN82_HETGA|nr:vesicle transport protein GOT1A isoform X2 [Heterocephalus glaber]